jgi:hypothetical protein
VLAVHAEGVGRGGKGRERFVGVDKKGGSLWVGEL